MGKGARMDDLDMYLWPPIDELAVKVTLGKNVVAEPFDD